LKKRFVPSPEDVERITNVADFVVNYMKSAGVFVQRYDAMTTASVYLKFDFGMANSMRISDHRGIDNLHYKYNVRTDVTEIVTKGEDGFERNYFPIDQAEAACRMILIAKFRKIGKFGLDWYNRTMDETLEKKAYSKNRFWKACTRC
jgi:hypothetical protein